MIAGMASPDSKGTKLSPDEREELQKLLIEYVDIFAINPNKPSTTDLVMHDIDTGDHKPINVRPYPIPKAYEQTAFTMINEMLKDGIISPTKDSPWGFPIVLTPKKDGKLRFCIDYRKLNAITRTSSYPIPLIQELLDCFNGAKYFSSLDLASGYWQIRMHPDSKEKTTFNSKMGSYYFNVMPFGLVKAPATFQSLIDRIYRDIQYKFMNGYFDDLSIYSKTFKEHLLHLREVFDRLRKNKLQAKITKCKFVQRETVFLGHLVSAEGIKPDPDKIKAVREWRIPRSKKDIRSFVGLCSYYRKFIPHFATIAEPLHRLQSIKETVVFEWKEEQQRAFKSLQKALTTAPILIAPDWQREFILQTDASDYGLGAVLCQEINGDERVIAYASKSLNKAQKNYMTSDKECLAIIYGVKNFRTYLIGRKFTLYTDHAALQFLQTMKLNRDLSGRLSRYQMFLQEFVFDIKYKKGTSNDNADALSRNPLVEGDGRENNNIMVVEVEDPEVQPQREDEKQEEKYDPSVGHEWQQVSNRKKGRGRPKNSSRKPQSIGPGPPQANPLGASPANAAMLNTVPPVTPREAILIARQIDLLQDMPSIEDMRRLQREDEELRIIIDGLEGIVEGKSDMKSAEGDQIGQALQEGEEGKQESTNDSILVPHGVSQSRIEGKEKESPNKFSINGDGLLVWRRIFNFELLQCPVIPKILRHIILHNMHSDSLSGHLGIHKTYEKMCIRFHWKGMFKDVQNFVLSCRKCAARKNPKKPAILPPSPHVPEGGPWQDISYDAAGPFPRTIRGNVHMVVFICRLTKYVEIFPVPDLKEETIANLLVYEIFSRHGCPARILTDRAATFNSGLMQQIYALMNSTKISTTPYNPQSNGEVEVMNNIIKTMLSQYVNHSHTDWDQHINLVKSAYHSVPHSSTGYTPNYLMFGRELKLPVDKIISAKEIYYDQDDYLSKVLKRIAFAQDLARARLLDRKIKLEEKSDGETFRIDYNKGELVYVFVPDATGRRTVATKLLSRWHGPFEVWERTSVVNYRVKRKLDEGGMEARLVNVRRMKPYVRPSDLSVMGHLLVEQAERKISTSENQIGNEREIPPDSEAKAVRVDNEAELVDFFDPQDQVELELPPMEEKKSDGVRQELPQHLAPAPPHPIDHIDDGAEELQDEKESRAPLYEVEKILNKAYLKDKVFYYVKWVGFSKKYNTWEPLDHLDGSQIFIEEYEKKTRLERQKYNIPEARPALMTVPNSAPPEIPSNDAPPSEEVKEKSKRRRKRPLLNAPKRGNKKK